MLKFSLVIILINIAFYSYSQSKYALVIGNSDYDYLVSLKNAKNDAVDLAETLSSMGFEVDHYNNLNQIEFKQAISAFGAKAKVHDILLFYYAGHGIEIGGKNYFVPIDALASSVNEVKKTCVSANAITQFMKLAKAQTNIIILDACRENPFKLLPSYESNDGLALMDAPTGTIISFATAPGNVASDGEGDNGVYTEALLKYLPAFDVEIKDVFANVRNSVVEATNNQQIPWESTSLTGQVILRPKPELSIQVNILEGDSIQFEGNGELHAVSNLKGVSFNWYFEDRQFSNGPTVNVSKTGNYRVKAISKEGQIFLTEPINVVIKSFVVPKPWIQEGDMITIVNEGYLHGKSNVRGKFSWMKDEKLVGNGASLLVDIPGNYVFKVVTEEGKTAFSESIFVRIKVK